MRTARSTPARSAVLSPQLTGVADNASLSFASTLCWACYDVCPVAIDIPSMLVHLRTRVVDGKRDKGALFGERMAMQAAAYAMATRDAGPAPCAWPGSVGRSAGGGTGSLRCPRRWAAGQRPATSPCRRNRPSATGGPRGDGTGRGPRAGPGRNRRVAPAAHARARLLHGTQRAFPRGARRAAGGPAGGLRGRRRRRGGGRRRGRAAPRRSSARGGAGAARPLAPGRDRTARRRAAADRRRAGRARRC